MADTLIKQSYRQRQVGGAGLIFITLPLSLITLRFGLPNADSLSDFMVLLPGPMLLLLGLWAVFPRRPPSVRMRIGDDAIRIESTQKVIRFDALQSISHHMPALAKHYRLTFTTLDEEIPFDLIHLTHEGRDIIKLIGLRLEKQGKHLSQDRSPVLGALTGVWNVQTGSPFETTVQSARLGHGRE